MAPGRLSPSQKHFLALYRKGIRAIRAKPAMVQPDFHLYLRQQFKRPFASGDKISKRDFAMIDYLGRTINRTLQNYFYDPSVKNIHIGQWATPQELGSARVLRNGHRVQGAGRDEAQ